MKQARSTIIKILKRYVYMKSPIIALASVLSVCCIIWISQPETKEASTETIAHTMPATEPEVVVYTRVEKETFIDPSLQQLAIRLGTPTE